jgi:hypothetical protein
MVVSLPRNRLGRSRQTSHGGVDLIVSV